MKLTDSHDLRVRRYRAFDAERYRFNPPPVYCGDWDDEAWHNWVHFEDAELNGYLPYDSLKDALARTEARHGRYGRRPRVAPPRELRLDV